MNRWYESYGTEAVPLSQRQGGVMAPFLIMVNFFINPGTIITAAMGIAAGLSVLSVIAVQFTGVLLGMIAFLVMARMGVDYGLTGQMACRAALGIRGGKWLTSPLRACCSIYWFAFQTQVGSLALAAVLQQHFGITIPLMQIALLFALAQVLVAVVGYRFLQGLFVWAFPLKMLCLAILVNALIGSEPAGLVGFTETFELSESNKQWLQIMGWFNAIFGGMLTMITDAADFTRYTSSRKALWIGGLSGSAVGVLVAAGFGAGAMVIIGGNVDQLFHGLLSRSPSITVATALIVLMILDNWTINVINLYSGGISLCHTFEKLGRGRCTLLVSLFAVGLSCFPGVIQHYLYLAEGVGILFAGIAGVLLMDYWLRNWQLNVPALYEGAQMSLGVNPYWYQGGFNTKAWGVIMMVVALGYSLPQSLPAPVLVIILGATCYVFFCKKMNG